MIIRGLVMITKCRYPSYLEVITARHEKSRSRAIVTTERAISPYPSFSSSIVFDLSETFPLPYRGKTKVEFFYILVVF